MSDIKKEDAKAFTIASVASMRIDPEKAMVLIQNLFQAASLSENFTFDAKITITTDFSRSEKRRCWVKGEICTPFGCYCVCIAPPGDSC